jgi:transposase
LNTIIKTGSRKGRRNYEVDFKMRLAIAACEPGVSVARIALDHGINANMLHKWRRAHLAGVVGIKPLSQPAFLAVSLAPAASRLVQSQAPAPSHYPTIPSAKQKVPKPGVIEIRWGAVMMRVEGSIDAATLGQVLRHLHP